jgi:AGZA family xanthine/uracil permease-like MFS transporter
MTAANVATAPSSPARRAPAWAERWFRLSARGTDLSTEVRAGLTTFMVMSYIIVVNPVVLTTGARLGGVDVSFTAILTSTCLVAGLCSLAMGLGANLPFALAPGMGVNAVVAYQLIAGSHYSYADAMGVIVVQGMLLTLFVISGLRRALLHAIPVALKMAIGAGIGLFLFTIGAYQAGLFVVPLGATQGGTSPPPTAGALGHFASPPTLLALLGLVITGALLVRGTRGAILIGILVTTLLGVLVQAALGTPLSVVPGKLEWPTQPLAAPDFSYLGIGLAGLGYLGNVGGPGLVAALLATLSIFLSDFFDVAGTFTALGTEAGLADANGNLREGENRAYLIDGVSSAIGGLAGCSSATTYIESGAGIAEGGRTGLTAVVAAVPFFLAMWVGNLFAIVPQEATAGALMIVGLLMLAAVGREIPWRDYSVGLPAIFALMLMPLTWSITNGIGGGLLLYALLNPRRAGVLVWCVALVFAVYFALGVH